MGNLGEAYYNLGVELFEVEAYEQAVRYLIQAYELGYERERILEDLYACFVLPNEQEFRNQYLESREGITELPFEECALDFIPVTEDRFYIFDKERQEFLDFFQILEEPTEGMAEEFNSILFAGLWDIREIFPVMQEKRWNAVYFLLEEAESRFVSFLKLPKFKRLYLRHVKIFQNMDAMSAFFEEHKEIYLPKSVISTEPKKHLRKIDELHVRRLHDMEQGRSNIFLSICIPSYNRGTIALKNVQHLLGCPYDNEIEIVISNNGSTEDAEGYQTISRIVDSRICYHAFEENQGFASNVLKTLELARGKYAVLVSDEDVMELEHMGEYFNCLKANPTIGVFQTSGKGEGFSELSRNEIYEAGMPSIGKMLNLNYMTGLTYHMELLNEVHAFDVMADMRGNAFLEYYTHIPLALLLGKRAALCKLKVKLWDGRKSVKTDNPILRNILPESRVRQMKGVMDFLYKGVYWDGIDFENLFLNRVNKTFFLLELAYSGKYEKFKELSTWEEICFYVYRESLEYLNGFPVILLEEEKESLKESIRMIFLEWLNSKEVLLKYPRKERPRRRILYQLIQIELEEYGKDIAEVESDIDKYLPKKTDGDMAAINMAGMESFLKGMES